MLSIGKILLVNVIFALLYSLYSAETVFVPDQSLLFKSDKEKKNVQIKAVVQKGFYCEVLKKEKTFLPRGEIGNCVDAYHLKIPGTDGLFFFPDVRFQKGMDGIITPGIDRIGPLMFVGILMIALGFAALAGNFLLRQEKGKYLLPAALVFFFWGYACWYIGFVSNALTYPSDEIFYYNMAAKLLALDFTSMKYHYTLGFPLLCIPFILLFHVKDYLEFINVYMNFQTFILIPGLFLVLYWFFYKKMGFSRIQSFCILFLWQILMVFYLPRCGTNIQLLPENYTSNASFSWIDDYNYFAFIQFAWLGRNAVCDYISVFLLVILLYLSMKKSSSLIRFLLLSMGFGVLCLTRLNYIFFAPLLAYIFYDSFSELWKNKRNYLYAALCGTAGFFIIFGWQFLLNKIQLGSPLVWPHSLHEFAPDRGFLWNVVPYGFKFLCQNNYIYLLLGLSSLLFIPNRKIRVLLSLWIFPMFLFFIGYPGIFQHPTRFIFALYPPLLAALVLNPVWQAVWPVRIKAALIVFSSCLLCKSNIFFARFQPWDVGKYGISNPAMMVIQGMIFLFCCAVLVSLLKELRTDYAGTVSHFRFLILFTSVFFLGSACIYIAGILVLAVLAYALRDAWLSIREIQTVNSDNPPATITDVPVLPDNSDLEKDQ